ncbi:GxxExxY protein [Geomesophilobacter sediminis]|uniref:GxxExxY protein n=1 Tax=Geomesophilobacter sediminis TaxID=2798584 RepID=A0A8J7LV71_9BACT|nr:GxxExxY protein [Geomesophilobacter sediminis]MBJ6725444.1 GxxExxY protein [Geomesophilobacter sediminis]
MDKLTDRIICCAFTVSNTLGAGFLEKVYENALAHELSKRELTVQQQVPVPVFYDGVIVGEYYADILINGQVIVELKASKALDAVHLAQCMNYLKATGLKVCLLLNFGNAKVEIKRVVNGYERAEEYSSTTTF